MIKIFKYSKENTINLLLLLLFLSSLPSLIAYSVFTSDISQLPFDLYYIFTSIRELVILLLGINLIILLLDKFIKLKINFKFVILLLGIFSFIYYFLSGIDDIKIFLAGLRFFILISLPALVINKSPGEKVINNYFYLDFINFFYLVLNTISYLYAFGNYKSFVGLTVFGPRFPFIFENPITASMSFGVMLLYFNFRIFQTNQLSTRFIFLFFSGVISYFILLTGGRAGLSIGLLSFFVSILRVFYPKIKYLFLTSKSYLKRNLIFFFIMSFAVISFLFVSNPDISGRAGTVQNIRDEGIIRGVYGARGEILNTALSNQSLLQFVFGKPGLGTNTAVTFVVCDRCVIPDSLLVSSFLSFGLIGWLILILVLSIFITYSYSPLVPITFVVYALSQSLPELIFPWTQLLLILAISPGIKLTKKNI